MPDTPPPIRGQLYSTHLFARCYDYHQCRCCLMCQNYNQHSMQCQACESGKPGARHHTCTQRRQTAMAQLEDRLGRPMHDINAKPSKVVKEEVADLSFNPGNVAFAKELKESD